MVICVHCKKDKIVGVTLACARVCDSVEIVIAENLVGFFFSIIWFISIHSVETTEVVEFELG